ncbi:MAG: cupin domain-containing protein [Scytonematopsis contorta HA4267-MV1]|jgi:quercetin dioxygenase-like cupin family protein|nr:cupin domain-containing protein [Scytonematopsis contorta HA4267-MV1]
MDEQIFIESNAGQWEELEGFGFSGVKALALGVPVPQGSIHLVRMPAGTVFPPYKHPSDEYAYIISGTINSGGRVCEGGTFWFTPANVRNGPHIAVTDCEIISIRLGAFGVVEKQTSPENFKDLP